MEITLFRNDFKKLSPKTFILIGAFFIISGIGLIGFWFYPDLRLAQESVNWPTTEAYIQSSSLERGSEGKPYLSISYTYSVEDTEYSSGKVYVGVDSKHLRGSSSHASENHEKFKKGRNYPAYYNPKDHSYAVLDPGPKQHHYIFLIAFSIWPLVGLAFILWGTWKVNKEKKSKLQEHHSSKSAIK